MIGVFFFFFFFFFFCDVDIFKFLNEIPKNKKSFGAATVKVSGVLDFRT
jgi:hypothetical protein